MPEEARTLLGLLQSADRASDTPTIDAQTWDSVIELAARHGVAGLLDRALAARGLPVDLPEPSRERLQAERRATALGNLRNYGEFQRVARALEVHRIPVMPLKGLHLAELVYQDISLRPMSDLDILVPRACVEEATTILRSLNYGYDANLGQSAGRMLDTKCNLGVLHQGLGAWLELHWSLDEPPDRYSEVVNAIWRAGVVGRVGDVDVRVMPPAFLLLHVCVHLACNHTFAFGLRALCDIAEIARQCPEISWSEVVEYGKHHVWQRGVAASLQLARAHLGARIPLDVLRALGADALDRMMLNEALEHLLAFSDIPQTLRTAPNLIAASTRGSLAMLEQAWARVFVPRAELALLYGVPENAAHLPLFYVLRLRDLMRRYAANTWRLKVADSALAAAVARHARLSQWINES